MDCRGRRLCIGDALSMCRIRCAENSAISCCDFYSLYACGPGSEKTPRSGHLAHGTHWPRDASYKGKRSGTPRSGTHRHGKPQ
jgi:hypothetical protein